jgi:hypothetical protein
MFDANAQQNINKLTSKEIIVNGRLEVNSTDKASKPCPEMTETERDLIALPLVGDCIYNTSSLKLNIYNGSLWKSAGGGIEDWQTGFSYAVGDVVVESGKIYQCNTAHVSSTFISDITNWDELSNDVSSPSGVLPLSNGGTGKNLTASDGSIVYSDADSIELLPPGTSGQVLQSNGVSAPSFVNKSISSKSQNGSSLTLEEIQVPSNQLTETVANKNLIETGNKNLLVNPGFEHATVGTGWSTSVTGTAVATYVPETTYHIFGKKSANLYCESGVSGGTCTFYQDVPTSYRLDGVVSIYLKVDFPGSGAYKVFARNNGVNTSAEIEVESNEAQLIKIPYPTGTTSTGIAIVVTPPPSAIFEAIADEAFVGVQDVKQDMPVIEEQGEWLLFSSNLTTSSNINSLTSSKDTAFKGIYTKSTSGLTFNKDATVNVSMFYSLSGTSAIDLRINHQSALCGITNRVSSTNPSGQVDCNMKVKAGDVINFETTGTGTVSGRIVITATSIDETTTVATRADFFSTDTNTLVFKPTTAIVAADPVGTFNTYSYAINSNTRTICGTAPTQTVANMKDNGFLIYTRAYNAASTCANPARVEIKIAPAGTSLPTLSKELYKNTGKSIAGSLDYFGAGSGNTSSRGLRFKDYDESTGILALDSGFNESTVTSHSFIFSDATSATSGYLVINAQKAKTTAVADFKEFDYVYVEAESNSSQSIGTTNTDYVFEDEVSDFFNAYNSSNGTFTVPQGRSGLYKWESIVTTAGMTLAGRFVCSLVINGTKTINGSRMVGIASLASYSSTISTTINLSEGDSVKQTCISSTATTNGASVDGTRLTISRIPGQFR